MHGLLVLFQISTAFGRWAAALLALASSVLNPAPRHATQRHHQPVTLPELASAGQLEHMR
jgi:hypothetical protein